MNPRDLEELWRDQFDWIYREYNYAVFPLCLHPDVSGRPQVLMMLERLIEHMQRHPGVTFDKYEDVAGTSGSAIRSSPTAAIPSTGRLPNLPHRMRGQHVLFRRSRPHWSDRCGTYRQQTYDGSGTIAWRCSPNYCAAVRSV